MSVTVPLVTFDPSDENRGGKQRTKMGEEKSNYNENDAVHLASFTQVPVCCYISPYVYCKLKFSDLKRMGRWIHRFRRTRQMMSDVHPGPDAGFLERYATGDHQEEGRSDVGWNAFLCRQHCHGQLVVDTTQKGHYRVSKQEGGRSTINGRFTLYCGFCF
jgi:hypothetical protein